MFSAKIGCQALLHMYQNLLFLNGWLCCTVDNAVFGCSLEGYVLTVVQILEIVFKTSVFLTMTLE